MGAGRHESDDDAYRGGMHAAGQPSWEAREGMSREVLVALYVRDALGVPDPSGMPRLLGTGLDAPPADEEFTASWIRWWRQAVEPDGRGWGVPLELVGGSRLVALPARGAERFTDAVRPHVANAETWAEVAIEQHKPRTPGAVHERLDDGLWGVVTDRVRALGRPAHPFRLRIEIVPVAVPGIWWIGDSAIAVAESLRSEAPAYRAALVPIIARLA